MAKLSLFNDRNHNFIHLTLNKNSIMYRSNYIQEFITILYKWTGLMNFIKKIKLNNINCIVAV